MPIINLRKYYYPIIRKDTFVEVSDEVAEALEEGLRIERRQEKKMLYHKVFSMDTNDWTQLHISVHVQSPEDVLLQIEEHADQERNLSHISEAFSYLTPIQVRRIRARYALNKKFWEIAEDEGIRCAGGCCVLRTQWGAALPKPLASQQKRNTRFASVPFPLAGYPR